MCMLVEPVILEEYVMLRESVFACFDIGARSSGEFDIVGS